MKRLTAILALVGCVGVSPGSYASDQDGLKLELTPYLWAIGVNGKVTVEDQSAHFNRDFGDIVDNVDAGFSGLGVASYDRFVVLVQYDYLSISEDANARGGVEPSQIGGLPRGTKVKADLDTDILTVAGGYRFDTFGKDNFADLMFGYRQTSSDLTRKALGLKGENHQQIGDYIVMLRPSFQIGERWRFNPTFSYAVAGDSDSHYELSPQIQYQFSSSFAARFGYRTLHYRVSDGKRGNGNFDELDTDIAGLFLGLGWTFPAQH